MNHLKGVSLAKKTDSVYHEFAGLGSSQHGCRLDKTNVCSNKQLTEEIPLQMKMKETS
jgi:hypothetical protein